MVGLSESEAKGWVSRECQLCLSTQLPLADEEAEQTKGAKIAFLIFRLLYQFFGFLPFSAKRIATLRPSRTKKLEGVCMRYPSQNVGH